MSPLEKKFKIASDSLSIFSIFTAARPAYAGTEGCYEMLVFFNFFYLMRDL